MAIQTLGRSKPNIANQLMGGVAGGAQAFSEAMGAQQNKQKQEQQYNQENQVVKNLIGKDISGIRDPKVRQEFVSMALQGENQQNKFNQENDYDEKSYKTIESTFGKKFADIWKAAPTGGRTEIVRHGLQALERGINLDETLKDVQVPNKSQNENPESNYELSEEGLENPEDPRIKKPLSKDKQIKKELNDYLKDQDKGLLPSEKVARGKERFDTGLKQYQTAGEKLRGLSRDKERFDILEDLEKSKKLPKDLGRINVDEEGNLRLPFMANPETQRFVKTLNEFSSNAKDTFGSRVTNFDLAQYLKRFPTLLNTQEGRKQILQQMRLVNQINSVYYKNLKNVYDESGGVRNIDADIAERYTEKLSEDKIDNLSAKFKEIGTFESKPAASEFNGKKIKDKKTGEIFISNGKEWVPQGAQQ